MLISFICFFFDSKYNTFLKLQNIFESPRYYIMKIVDMPFALSKNLSKYFVLHKKLAEENVSLRQQLNIESARSQVMQSLELENIRLKSLLKFTQSRKNVFSLANIIEVDPDPFPYCTFGEAANAAVDPTTAFSAKFSVGCTDFRP